jgi:hypothetical protein
VAGGRRREATYFDARLGICVSNDGWFDMWLDVENWVDGWTRGEGLDYVYGGRGSECRERE